MNETSLQIWLQQSLDILSLNQKKRFQTAHLLITSRNYYWFPPNLVQSQRTAATLTFSIAGESLCWFACWLCVSQIVRDCSLAQNRWFLRLVKFQVEWSRQVFLWFIHFLFNSFNSWYILIFVTTFIEQLILTSVEDKIFQFWRTFSCLHETTH